MIFLSRLFLIPSGRLELPSLDLLLKLELPCAPEYTYNRRSVHLSTSGGMWSREARLSALRHPNVDAASLNSTRSNIKETHQSSID